MTKRALIVSDKGYQALNFAQELKKLVGTLSQQVGLCCLLDNAGVDTIAIDDDWVSEMMDGRVKDSPPKHSRCLLVVVRPR